MASDFKLKFSKWGATLLVLVFGIQTYAVVSLSLELKRVNEVVLEQARCAAVISHANALSKLFYDAGVAMGGYSITKNKTFADSYASITAQLPLEVEELKALTAGHPESQEPIAKVDRSVKTGLGQLADAKAAIDDNRADVAQFRARHMYKQVRMESDKIQTELAQLVVRQQKSLSKPALGAREMIGYVGLSSVLIFGIMLDAVKNSGAPRQVE